MAASSTDFSATSSTTRHHIVAENNNMWEVQATSLRRQITIVNNRITDLVHSLQRKEGDIIATRSNYSSGLDTYQSNSSYDHHTRHDTNFTFYAADTRSTFNGGVYNDATSTTKRNDTSLYSLCTDVDQLLQSVRHTHPRIPLYLHAAEQQVLAASNQRWDDISLMIGEERAVQRMGTNFR
jgi:hypothetical protein